MLCGAQDAFAEVHRGAGDVVESLDRPVDFPVGDEEYPSGVKYHNCRRLGVFADAIKLARRDRRATVWRMTEVAETKTETLEQLEDDSYGAAARLRACYRAEIERLEGDVETAEKSLGDEQERYDSLADSLAELLPGKIDTHNKEQVEARIAEVFDLLDDVRELVKIVEPLLGGHSDDDSTETNTLRRIIYRLSDRLG